jgi:hypothetical protein
MIILEEGGPSLAEEHAETVAHVRGMPNDLLTDAMDAAVKTGADMEEGCPAGRVRSHLSGRR